MKAVKTGESGELARKLVMTIKDTNRKKPPAANKQTKALKKVGTRATKEQKRGDKND